jgi:hypothetical protein
MNIRTGERVLEQFKEDLIQSFIYRVNLEPHRSRKGEAKITSKTRR